MADPIQDYEPAKQKETKTKLPRNIIESAACLIIKRRVFCQVNVMGEAADQRAALVIV